MKKIFCISGKAQNGKDTSALLIKDELEAKGKSVLIIHYADLLKFICKSFFGWNGEKDVKGRTLLQYVGTEIIRTKEPDFWVDFINKILNFFDDKWDYIIIPDTRFPNEITKLISDNSMVFHIRVIRPGFDSPLTKQQQQHISETALDDFKTEFILTNDGSINDLRYKIQKMLSFLEINGV